MKVAAFSGLVAAVTIAVFTSTSESKSLEQRSAMPARRHHAKAASLLNKRDGKFSGIATWYGIHEGDMGACGTALHADEHLVALNEGQYGSLNSQSSYCGKTITITNGQKTTTAKILDACPKGEQCHWGALDMSRSLFSFFNDFGVGEFDITWWVNGQGGGDDSGSNNSGNSNSNDSDNGNDDSDSDSGGNDDDSDAVKVAQKTASRVADNKAAAAKKQAAADAAAKKQAAADAAAKEAADAKKKKAAKAAKAKAAAEAKAKAQKEAEAKAKAEKIQDTQQQNLASFGQIMETLNQMVTEAAAPASTDAAASAMPSTSALSSAAPEASSASSALPVVSPVSA